MTDTPKFIHIPTSFEVTTEDLAAASREGSILESARRHFIDDAIITMREREEKVYLDGMTFDHGLGFFHNQEPEPPDAGDAVANAMAMIEATAGGVLIGGRQRVIKMPGDGEPAYLMLKEPDPVRLTMPMSMDMPKPDPIDFVIGQRCGGFDVRPPMRIVTVIDMPMPRAPGVDAMLADGWVWTGWRFARDQTPRKCLGPSIVVRVEDSPGLATEAVFIRTNPVGDLGTYRHDDDGGNAVEVPGMRWVDTFRDRGGERRALIAREETIATGRYAGHINDRPVLAGRYADRLPTNRRRKRERCKARRRAGR